ncbi:MAG: tetratricopeptide repeat protein [Bernardetiaceae bacterium]|nr:tetratricopeptide repeat protein [Bernardetiaceae bacterium]
MNVISLRTIWHFCLLSILCITFPLPGYGQDVAPLKSGYEDAVTLFEKKRYGLAKSLFEDFISQNPEHLKTQEAHIYMARCDIKLKNPNFEYNASNLLDQNQDNVQSRALRYELTNWYFSNKQYREAIALMENHTRSTYKNEQEILAHFQLAYALMHTLRYREASQLFKKLAESDFKKEDSNYYLGFLLANEQDYAGALKALQIATQNKTYKQKAYARIAEIHHYQGNYQAVIDLEAVIPESKMTDNTRLVFAWAAYKIQNYDLAYGYLARYFDKVEVTAQEEALLFAYAYAAQEIREMAVAQQAYRKLSTRTSNDSIKQIALFNAVNVALENNEPKQALQFATEAQAVNIDPLIHKNTEWIILCLLYKNRTYKAFVPQAVQFHEAQAKNMQAEELLIFRRMIATALHEMKDYRRLQAFLQQYAQADPELSKLAYNIELNNAIELLNSEYFHEALAAFQALYQKKNKYANTAFLHYYIAETYQHLENSERALYFYEQALAAGSDEKIKNLSHFSLAYHYYNTDSYDMALKHFHAYIEAESEDQSRIYEAHARIGDAYYAKFAEKPQDKNLFSFAIKHYDYALTDKSNTLSQHAPRLNLARLYAYNRNYNKAIFQIETLLERSTQTPDMLFPIYEEKAEIYIAANLPEAAIRLFENLIEENKFSTQLPNAYLKLGNILERTQNREEAIDVYKHVVQKFVKYPAAELSINFLINMESAGASIPDLEIYVANYEKYNPQSDIPLIRRLNKARDLLFNDEKPEAQKLLESIISSTESLKTKSSAHYLLGKALLEDNPKLAAYHLLEVALVGDNQSEYLDSKMLAADIKFKMSEYATAEELFAFVENNSREEAQRLRASLGLAEIYFKRHQFSEAIIKAERLKSQSSEGSYFANAASLIIVKAANQAKRPINEETLSAMANQNIGARYAAEFLFNIGVLFEQNQNAQSALQAYERVINQTTADNYLEFKEKAQFQKALILHKQGDAQSAIMMLEELSKQSQSQSLREQALLWIEKIK